MLHFNEADKHLYDNQPFIIPHDLARHPLLDMGSLSEMIQRLPRNQVFFSSASVSKDADFDRAFIEHRPKVKLVEALRDMSNADSYVMVRGPESDPAYRQLFEKIHSEIAQFTGVKGSDIRDAMFYLFISSPNSVTPFHVDRYTTFLMQLSGVKTVYVWDPRDRLTVSEESKEVLFADRNQRSPLLPQSREHFGMEQKLQPGDTLHIPFTAPHWVKNGPEISISLSIIYRTFRTDRIMNAYRFNHRLRLNLGINPAPVGNKIWVDATKDIFERGVQRLGRMLGGSN